MARVAVRSLAGSSDEGLSVYDGWQTERWETPVSDLLSVGLVEAVQRGSSLALTIEDLRSPDRTRWQITFADSPIYRNILEEFRLELWGLLPDQHGEDAWVGTTRLIPESPWLADLKEHEPLIEVHYPDLIHFQIVTEDDVFDVLSAEYPTLKELGPAPEDAPPAGRSEVYLFPNDAKKIGGLLKRVAAELMGRRRKDAPDES